MRAHRALNSHAFFREQETISSKYIAKNAAFEETAG